MVDSASKLTPPASPTASFYDLSDDEEGEYNTIMHSSSGRGVKLLFSKSKVCSSERPSSVLPWTTDALIRFTYIPRLHRKITSPGS